MMVTKSITSGLLSSSLQFTSSRKVRLVMQDEANECGMACLCMIANYHGNGVNLASLRLCASDDGQGVSLKNIIEQAALLGLSSRALKVPLDDLNQLRQPAILHWNFSHFVVLIKVSKGGIYIADPAIGKRFVATHEVNESFTGVALELTPNQDFTKVKAQVGLRLRDFARGATGLKRQLFLLIGLSLMLQLFAVVAPFYMQTVIDEVLVKADESLLFTLAVGFGLLLLVDTLTDFIRQRVMLEFSMRFSAFLSSSVFSHLLSLPTDYFMRRHMGDIVSRFASVQHIRELITSGIIAALIDGIMVLITLLVMLVYSWQLTIVVLTIVLVYSLLRWAFFYPVRRINKEVLHADAHEQSYFMQSIRAIRTLKLNDSLSSSHAKWSNKLITALNKRISLESWKIRFSIINKVLFGFENLLVIYLAAQLVMAQNFTVGMLFAFVSYKGRFIGSMSALIEKWIEFKMLSVHLERVADIVLTSPEANDVFQAKQSLRIAQACEKSFSPDVNRGLISVNNISFRYSQSKAPIFENVSFEVPSGHSLAIIGQSGCGKSTLLNCLLGLLTCETGQISINGHPLTTNNRDSHGLAAVLQDDQLLSGSILENITQFDEKIHLERAIKCAQIACIHEDIMAMTMQYQTTVGDMGDALSGGQKQRVLIARALYRMPKVLLLDEASSHLDIATEKRLNAHLQNLKITKIMIAHRPETIASAQHILRLSKHGVTDVTAQFKDSRPTLNNDQKGI
ncbi:peptidase domain-containing ABC transporter [Glaciecola sp. XM2]|jgi:ATP-binding cassette subfamily B protein RaxB|uniref:peptidase domain-containing ABC transporter n=1 Tax=Glaciecola sp. XM2 TaxID=1914931 RepID=UPI001BDF45EF|nr:peptidase domain-containing ABC transporter [Glaciecola sp. XM2]MBT1450292.1 peptidase domain-containing ABC transporter [Glaciecola sp. XM2]